MEWIKRKRGGQTGGGGFTALRGSLPFGVRVCAADGLMDCERRAAMKVDVDETRRTN